MTEKTIKDIKTTRGKFLIATIGFWIFLLLSLFLFGNDSWVTIVFGLLTTVCVGAIFGITYVLIKMEVD